MLTDMGWWDTARTAAAGEFGRRHYRAFAFFGVARWAAPFLGFLAVAGFTVYGYRRLGEFGAPVLALAGLVLFAALIVFAVRRWAWMMPVDLMLYPGRAAAAVLVVVLLLAGGGVAYAMT